MMLYATAPEGIGELLDGEPSYRSDQIRRWLYETPVLSVGDMTNLPLELRERLKGELWPFVVEAELDADRGRTKKWLFRAPDGASIECVLMAYPKRMTLCVSSQAGCAMACTFCATGQFGFERHLSAGEIVAQVMYANAVLRERSLAIGPDRVTNLVFMGMGEPLANYTHLRESLRRLIDVAGFSARGVTVSTVGVVPGIRRLAAEPWSVNLAVSLHAADDELRSRLVPLNKRYPLAEVIDACHFFFAQTGRRVSIEWTLIADTNDSEEQAGKLATIAQGMHAHVNLIAMNSTPLSVDQPPDPARVDAFTQVIRGAGVTVTLRDTRGDEINAACGQLRVQRSDRAVPRPIVALAGGTLTLAEAGVDQDQ